MQWTSDQQKVISERGKNILVSAAAGSGKTAVLVERIIQRILDPEDPCDIDELLIVTFTKAAAGEMRERIGRRIAAALSEDPENEHLKEQSALLHSAQITTIDGFCSYVVREYGTRIDLAPGMRVAEEGEIALLEADVLDAVLEAAHTDEAGRAAWIDLVESVATGKSEKELEDAIRLLYRTAVSAPDPKGWLKECHEALSQLEQGTQEEMEKFPFMRMLMADADADAQAMLDLARRCSALCKRADGPGQQSAVAEKLLQLAEAFAASSDYAERRRLLRDYQPERLSRKKEALADPALIEQFRELRLEAEDIRKKKLLPFFALSPDEAFLYQKKSAGPLKTLLEITDIFREAFAEEKSRRNLMDFSDLEHFALRILRQDPDGSLKSAEREEAGAADPSVFGERTEAAKELAAGFREVMIDEYQDSNYLQEAVLTAVSRIEDGEPNYFCVGDVKQSIYSFRQARPELFLRKAALYKEDPGKGTRIDLHQNFRSRPEVLDCANALFTQLMQPALGGIAYDREAALYPGASYPASPGMDSELICVPVNEADEGDAGRTKGDAREAEAYAVGTRIRELLEYGQIYDRKEERLRPVRRSDIVILLRSMSGWADTFVRVLEDLRIPAVSTAAGAYFTTQEVQQVLSFLSILDNPYQDIPFAAVLAGPMAGFSADELSRIRVLGGRAAEEAGRKKPSFYEAALYYAEEGEGAFPTLERLRAFLEMWQSFRDRMGDMRLGDLVWAVLRETGYYDYAGALPGGAQRKINLKTLVDRAEAFEETSYKGLFHFIRYIRRLRQMDRDLGEAGSFTEADDVVRISSIHKSKGLEYPIVICAGMGKRFNLRDAGNAVLVHPLAGPASDYIDYVKRVRYPTLLKRAVAAKIKRDQLGEELRVLYVALTRAEQKLIICGTVASEEKWEELDLDLSEREEHLPEHYLLSSGTPFAWIAPAVKRINRRAERYGDVLPVTVRIIRKTDVLLAGRASGVKRAAELLKIRMQDPEDPAYVKVREELESRFSYRYPYAGLSTLPIEISVSELKRASEGEPEGEERPAWELYPEGPLDETGDTSGKEMASARGTAFHRMMELLDYGRMTPDENGSYMAALLPWFEEVSARGLLSEEEAELADPADADAFLRSDLGRRMKEASDRGTLWREQAFVLGMDASEIRPEWPREEMVFVQGIVDAFFREGDSLVLVDYKTDRVRTAAVLEKRYRLQLALYQKAVSRITGLPAADARIWSTALRKEICLRADLN